MNDKTFSIKQKDMKDIADAIRYLEGRYLTSADKDKFDASYAPDTDSTKDNPSKYSPDEIASILNSYRNKINEINNLLLDLNKNLMNKVSPIVGTDMNNQYNGVLFQNINNVIPAKINLPAWINLPESLKIGKLNYITNAKDLISSVTKENDTLFKITFKSEEVDFEPAFIAIEAIDSYDRVLILLYRIKTGRKNG